MQKTGWPAPDLMQDDHRKLFRWFAERLDSRKLVREAVLAIKLAREKGQQPPEGGRRM